MYFFIFAVQVAVFTAKIAWQVGFIDNYLRFATYVQIGERVSSVVLAIAAWSMMVILFLEGIRVLADKVLGRRFAEGEKEANRKWQAWLERKEEAERKNEAI